MNYTIGAIKDLEKFFFLRYCIIYYTYLCKYSESNTNNNNNNSNNSENLIANLYTTYTCIGNKFKRMFMAYQLLDDRYIIHNMYICIYMCVCVCVYVCNSKLFQLSYLEPTNLRFSL